MVLASVMGTSELTGTYTYHTSMTNIWDILFQGVSLFMLVTMLVICVLTIMIIVKGIQTLNLYIKKNKIE